MTSHHDVTGRGYGICGELLRTSPQLPQPRRRRSDEIEKSITLGSGAPRTRLGKRYLLDTCLLMGGTHVMIRSTHAMVAAENNPIYEFTLMRPSGDIC